jgi:hypothetical protein
MSQTQIDFNVSEARQRRDDGMQRAADHADRVHRDWQTMAYEFFTNVFLKHHKGTFMAEDFRASCKGVVPDPPSLRAFGAIITKARKNGLITRVAIKQVKNPKANCAMANVWHKT